VTVPLACACRAAFRVSGPGTALSEPGRDRDSDGDRESAAGSCSSRNSSPGVAEAVLEFAAGVLVPYSSYDSLSVSHGIWKVALYDIIYDFT